MNEWISTLKEMVDTQTLMIWAGQALAALAIFVVGRWIARAIVRATKKMMRTRGMDPILVDFLGTLLNIGLLTLVIIFAINQLGIETTPLVAVLGAAGLAVGLAMQGSLSNLAAGVMLVIFRPFTKGDFVEAGGISGTVERVGIFNTILNTTDNRRIIVPNNEITSNAITNFTANATRRIDLTIGVDYGDDLRTARDVMNRVIRSHEKVLDDPEPVVLLMELADSSVNFAVRSWVATPDYWQVRNELLEQLKLELEAAGCSIPFPQRDVHLHTSDASAAGADD
ncbi:MAG: small-conductance mechanosensitive channel MscS [Wenzhouxiangellaceae bacterium]